MSDTESPNRASSSDSRRNPFAAPTACVEDARRTIDDVLTDRPNKVAAGRGLEWWREGWGIFREAGWLWIGIGLALTVINIVIALVPMIGDLATSLLFPVFGGGLMLGCHAIDAGEDLRFGHLFAGFQNKLGRLLMISVLCLPVIFVIAAAGFFFVVAPIEESIGYFYNRMPPELNLSLLLSVILFSSVLVALLCMAAWFAPALVALHEEPTAFEAMKLSFRGCLRNWLPFLVYGLVFIVLAILASLILLLGWLVLMPVIYCSTYAAYRDIFTVERR